MKRLHNDLFTPAANGRVAPGEGSEERTAPAGRFKTSGDVDGWDGWVGLG